MSRFLLAATTLFGVVLLVAGFLTLDAGRVDEVGEVPAPTTAAPPTSATPEPEPTPTPEPSAATAPAPDPEPEPAPASVAAPVSLAIPSIGVDASSVRVGLEPDGAMEIPADVTTVGWYELGVAPGEAGSAVIAGHVDSRTQGRGAFFDLRELAVGDVAELSHEDGAVSRWEVVGRTSYPKDEAPLAELFRRGGEPQLALITCGGEFDATARSYAENVVVVLEPA